jgi:hypothetical protein
MATVALTAENFGEVTGKEGDGVIVLSQPGAFPGSALESLIIQVEKLDMEEVRKQLAAHQH